MTEPPISIESWPHGRQGDIPYSQLDPVRKDIVTKHLKLSGKIVQLTELNSFLFRGKAQVTNFSTFPCQFRDILEEVMRYDLGSRDFNYTPVYYQHVIKPPELKFSEFNPAEWVLSTGPKITQSDLEVFYRFRTLFLSFLSEALEAIKLIRYIDSQRKGRALLRREAKRIIRLFGLLPGVAA